MNKMILVIVCWFVYNNLFSQDTINYNSPCTGNPLVPGYFADPTIKKFGDTYYLYATTDGIRLASGQPQVWISKDFVNWYNYEMELPMPSGMTNCWAPDVVKGNDGKYYYFHGNCEAGCNIYGYVSDTPIGPWTNINSDNAVIPVGTGTKDLPALDAQYLLDDDGSLYSYFGTWCTSFGGLGWAQIDPGNMKTILKQGLIPVAQLPEVFEGAYPIKKNNKYIIMYSSGDCQASSYRVQYGYGNSPTGPFTKGANNPILKTNSDGTIDGPGHHSILQDGDNYYIIYHRHDNPHSGGGEFRQVCADSLFFEDDSTIRAIMPTHKGIGYLGPNQITFPDLAYKAKVSASSYYHLISNSADYIYEPGYAVDNNNGTMWRAGSNNLPQFLTIDLDSVVNIRRIMTQFEYTTFYYQYKIEYSEDSINWNLFVDKTNNRRSGSPMIDDNDINARYLKITITGTEKTGLFAAIWNIKVYNNLFDVPNLQNNESVEGPGVINTKSLLVNLDADSFEAGDLPDNSLNTGTLGGTFTKKGTITVGVTENHKSITFGRSFLTLSEKAPLSLSWNSPFTISTWVYNPKVGAGECLVVWSSRSGNLMGEYAALMYGSNGSYGAAAHWGRLDMPYSKVPSAARWHHIALTFDGMIEKIYVDGVLNNEAQKNLFIHPQCSIIIGFSGESSEYFSGSIASLRMYDTAFNADGVKELMEQTKPDSVASLSIKKTEKSTDDYEVYYAQIENQIVIKEKNNIPIKGIKLIGMDGKVLVIKKNLQSSVAKINAPDKGFYILLIENTEKKTSSIKVSIL